MFYQKLILLESYPGPVSLVIRRMSTSSPFLSSTSSRPHTGLPVFRNENQDPGGTGTSHVRRGLSEFTILDYRIFWGIIQFIWWKSSTRKKHKKHFVKLKMTSWMGGRWLIWVKVTNTHWYNLRDFIFLSKEKMGDNLNQILQNHQNQLDSSHEMVQDMNHMKHEMHGANVHENHDMMMMMYFYFGYENVQMIIKAWVQNISWK